MSVLGIDEISYGADDLPACRQFFLDWGLSLVVEQTGRLVFETLNGCRVIVAATDHPDLPPAIEPGPTLREVVWGVESEADLALYAGRIAELPGFVKQGGPNGGRIGCTDPNGLAVRLQLTQKRDVQMQSAEYNTWDRKGRINQASPAYERAQPIEVGHVVFFVKDVQACERFYVENFGFAASDRYPERGAFLRTAPDGGHHDIFLLQRPDKHAGLNHVAFTVRDIHEVFGGGMHISRCGWDTQLGPGRHPVSSAYF
ncbi:MAG: VOC family protein, partial [Comamonas sp.]|uniref:VOC family protein n=1 Tax=Comamonas sp. TaxID=34028 RepID=UPI0028367619